MRVILQPQKKRGETRTAHSRSAVTSLAITAAREAGGKAAAAAAMEEEEEASGWSAAARCGGDDSADATAARAARVTASAPAVLSSPPPPLLCSPSASLAKRDAKAVARSPPFAPDAAASASAKDAGAGAAVAVGASPGEGAPEAAAAEGAPPPPPRGALARAALRAFGCGGGCEGGAAAREGEGEAARRDWATVPRLSATGRADENIRPSVVTNHSSGRFDRRHGLALAAKGNGRQGTGGGLANFCDGLSMSLTFTVPGVRALAGGCCPRALSTGCPPATRTAGVSTRSSPRGFELAGRSHSGACRELTVSPSAGAVC